MAQMSADSTEVYLADLMAKSLAARLVSNSAVQMEPLMAAEMALTTVDQTVESSVGRMVCSSAVH